MNKPATIALLVLLVLVIVFGKYHNQLFPRHVKTEFSQVTVRVPSNWIYSKGTEDYAFQLIVPSKRLAEPAGFITAKCMKSGDLDEYVAGDTENKSKTSKKDYMEARAKNAWVSTYTAKDKNKEARAAEYVISAPDSLWHLVGVFDESWFKKNGETAEGFVREFAKENFQTDIPALPREQKPSGRSETGENK